MTVQIWIIWHHVKLLYWWHFRFCVTIHHIRTHSRMLSLLVNVCLSYDLNKVYLILSYRNGYWSWSWCDLILSYLFLPYIILSYLILSYLILSYQCSSCKYRYSVVDSCFVYGLWKPPRKSMGSHESPYLKNIVFILRHGPKSGIIRIWESEARFKLNKTTHR